jgi:hypothetical protein
MSNPFALEIAPRILEPMAFFFDGNTNLPITLTEAGLPVQPVMGIAADLLAAEAFAQAIDGSALRPEDLIRIKLSLEVLPGSSIEWSANFGYRDPSKLAAWTWVSPAEFTAHARQRVDAILERLSQLLAEAQIPGPHHMPPDIKAIRSTVRNISYSARLRGLSNHRRMTLIARRTVPLDHLIHAPPAQNHTT